MKKIIIGAVIGGLIVAGIALVVGKQSVPLGGSTQSYWDAVGGFRVNGTEIISSSRAASFTTGTFSGDLTVTTANTATSSVEVGCLQTTATSTATPVRFVLSSTGTTTATFGAGTANGGVSWQYGTCPI